MFAWTVHLNRGPKRPFHAAVIVEHQVYSFGGEDSDSDHTEVLVFNTVSLCWMKVTPVTVGGGRCPLEVPSGRQSHTAVLIERTAYIWGGFVVKANDYCNVLYAFDVDTHRWFKPKVSGTVPKARAGHSACVLAKVMYVHGGHERSSTYYDTYKMDINTMVWSLIDTRGATPPSSTQHSATIIGTKMFVFGKGVVTRVFDTETNLWLKMPSGQLRPKELCHHSAFAYNGELYIFGGHYWFQTLDDLWKFNPGSFSWKKVETKGEGPGGVYKMCCCTVGERIIVFGVYKKLDVLYILDTSPSLKTLCKLAVFQYGLEQTVLPHNIRWELALAAMTNSSDRK